MINQLFIIKEMFSSFKRGASSRFIRFCVVGGSGVLVNNGVLWFLVDLVKVSKPYFYLCSFIAIEISIITNFLLNDYYTWFDRRSGSFFNRLLRYNLSSLVSSLAVNMTVLALCKEVFGLPYLFANLIGIGCGTVSNFTINSIWTYGVRREQK